MQIKGIQNRESLINNKQLQNNTYNSPCKLSHSSKPLYIPNNTSNSSLNSKKNYNNGIIAENIASNYLYSIQHTILFNRVRTPLGELDIVAQHKNTLVFIEVKFSENQNTAEFRVSENQKNRIVRSSEYIIQLIEHIKAKKAHDDSCSKMNDEMKNATNDKINEFIKNRNLKNKNNNSNQNNIDIGINLNNSLKSIINKLDCSSISNYKIDVIAISKKSSFSNYSINHIQNAIS